MDSTLNYGTCELACHECGHPETYRRKCGEEGCIGGLIQDDDVIAICQCCSGTGFEWWCPECRTDLNHARVELEFRIEDFYD